MEVTKKANDHKRSERDDDDDDILPPGFRFHPTDEELVGFYLKRKVEKKSIKIDLIQHIDVYKFEPWDLPKQANLDSVGEKEWYFFCRRGRKYKNSIRPNRVTGSGFWKATGIDKPIYTLGEFRDCIGLKKSLVYYRGSAGKGTKTDWMMHEFRLPATSKNSTPISAKNQEAEVWTLCRIFKREITNKKFSADWIKASPKLSYSDSSSKTSFSAGDAQVVERKPVMGDHFYTFSESDQNLMLAGQLNLTTQAPLAATYQNFPTQLGDEICIDWDWDELRPMVDPSMLLGFRQRVPET